MPYPLSTSLIEELARELERVRAPGGEHRTLDDTRPATERPQVGAQPDPRMIRIASDLITQALEHGLVPNEFEPTLVRLTGGNTALLVSAASVPIRFVFKADSNQKLVREARTISDLRSDARLELFRERLPRVYAIHDSAPPYAYLMEYFDPAEYQSLKQIFFQADEKSVPTKAAAVALVKAAFAPLARAYADSKDDRLSVRMAGEAYVGRISANLATAATLHPRFESRPVVVNDRQLLPWQHYCDRLLTAESQVQNHAPPFITMVHGDPNPGNILVKRSDGSVIDVKYIDLKDWKQGDYLFDFAKLTHFLAFTGPIEELHSFSLSAVEDTSTELRLQYTLQVPPAVTAAIKELERAAGVLAAQLHDEHWGVRYTLAMAANLLGLIPGRVRDGKLSESTIIYAEGLKYLDHYVRVIGETA